MYRKSKKTTGSCFSSLFRCSDLNKQICTVEVKTKAFIFAVSDRSVLSSEVSNFQAAFHDVWDVSVLVALTPGGGGGYSWEFLVGFAPARPPPPPGKSCWGVPPPGSLIFPIRFQTRSLKSVPISDLAFRQKLCCHYLDYSANKKNSSNPFQIRIFLFLFYSFGIETITSSIIHSLSSLKNHTWFQTKMAKVYTRFQTKTAQKRYPMGRHIPI